MAEFLQRKWPDIELKILACSLALCLCPRCALPADALTAPILQLSILTRERNTHSPQQLVSNSSSRGAMALMMNYRSLRGRNPARPLENINIKWRRARGCKAPRNSHAASRAGGWALLKGSRSRIFFAMLRLREKFIAFRCWRFWWWAKSKKQRVDARAQLVFFSHSFIPLGGCVCVWFFSLAESAKPA